MGLEATTSLLLAAFELGTVRLIRDAIRTADLSAGRGLSATPLGPDPGRPPAGRADGVGAATGVRPPDRYHPRRAGPACGCGGWATYDAGYDDGRRAPPAPWAGERAGGAGRAGDAGWASGTWSPAATCADVGRPVEPSCGMEGPIPPVWKTLPPVVHPAPPRRPVKIVRRTVDAHRRGLVLDVHA